MAHGPDSGKKIAASLGSEGWTQQQQQTYASDTTCIQTRKKLAAAEEFTIQLEL
ncbi:uncharacterized protein LDX57_000244 [Aspergillus melleus]|uniref:uncharacterized protein n=1 Tax=Aspergillus melleus TaxID=138277 RepID=UPI001E8CCEEF|nr:uncharacterized protein LDX57_000244 [Aspergillus melleus]KAH8422491.1 hypothetical protein LDX57_000244 [Aspergillus melleus]